MAIAKFGARNPNADASRLVNEHDVYVVDSADDVTDLPAGAAIGSMAVVVTTKDIYIVKCDGTWVKMGEAE